jgi:ATP-dependent helicase YprA (DUF1998 family)
MEIYVLTRTLSFCCCLFLHVWLQAEAYKLLLSSVPAVAVADQAGSGKTLAYLLPLLQQIHEQEQQLGKQATPPGSARVIVLTPTTGAGHLSTAQSQRY